MFKEERLMHQWESVTLFKLREPKKCTRRPKITSRTCKKKNYKLINEVTENITLNRIKWWKIIYIIGFN